MAAIRSPCSPHTPRRMLRWFSAPNGEGHVMRLGRAGTGGMQHIATPLLRRSLGMHRGIDECGETVFGLRKGPWGHPHADRIALVPPRCGKQRPARIDRSRSAETASSQRSDTSECS